MRKNRLTRPFISLILSTVIIGLASVSVVHAELNVTANPNSGKIFNFPAAGFYQNFSSNLTATGVHTGFGTPTWIAGPALGSPSCATHISVTFGNPNAWNTTATFNDVSFGGCQATMDLNVSSSSGPSRFTTVAVTYVFCARCV